MKAIVLTCDKYRPFTIHMIKTFQTHWPNNPFQFYVPYQQDADSLIAEYGNKVVPTLTERPIRKTVLTLLDLCHDEEWIYWSIDDKYIIDLALPEATEVTEWISTINDPSITIVSLSRCRSLLEKWNIKQNSEIKLPSGLPLIESKGLRHMWLHQFMRARILKKIFNTFPDYDYQAKEQDSFSQWHKSLLSEHEKVYVPQNNLIAFGESTTQGRITNVCVASFTRYGISVPQEFLPACTYAPSIGTINRK
ncbi:MAG: hypothetical protein HQL21_06500 [Candidatus Omnitrophica bacterium]|nr:hypothetical protein [Candidatus Omnitrophota bacterium]